MLWRDRSLPLPSSIKMKILYLFFMYIGVVFCYSNYETVVSVVKSSSENGASFKFTDGVDVEWIATANYKNAINETGWAYLEVVTNSSYPNEVQAYSAGIIEGYVTKNLIDSYWSNTYASYCANLPAFCATLEDFMKKNYDWMNMMINRYPNDPYWHQVKLVLIQANAVEDGYKGIMGKPSTDLRLPFGLLLQQLSGDLEDLSVALSGASSKKAAGGHSFKRVLGGGSCSALVKLLPGYKDLFTSHDTWSGYNSMLRILKKMHLGYSISPVSKDRIPGDYMTFSSYPASILSCDDFNVMKNSQLTTMETTIGNGNASLWKYVKPTTVLEAFRATVANRLATSGKEWSKLFSAFQSGTYNNEWIIVDYKKFKPGQKPTTGLLTVLDQIPSYIHSEDLTELLVKQGYFPSYNIPYFHDVYVMSGVAASAAKYGPWFDYNGSPRAQIFKRDHVKVVDLHSMYKLMRYNDFQNDPLSRCNCTPPYSGENAISARCDLNPINGTYPFGALGHRNHGGTDCKITSSSMALESLFLSVSGPTYDPLPPFQWSKSDLDKVVSHLDQPDLFTFPPIIHHWTTEIVP